MNTYIIVGGVAGGASTAARLRRIDEKSKIIMFERGQYISYANCGLPYYLGGTIQDRDNLFVQTPEGFGQRFNIDVRVKNEVLSIDRKNKEIKAKNLLTGEEYNEKYNKLILSPGAEPAKPPIPGINSQGIFTLRNVHDMDTINNYLKDKNPKRAVVIGGGFIGLEMAENLHDRGIFVTIVEMAEQVMTPLDYEMAAEVHQHLKVKNVEFFLKDKVVSFNKDGDKVKVNLDSQRELESDIVILSIGVRPENKLAIDAGIEIGQTRGIKVNKYLQTNDENIYAIGDAIEYPNPITKIPTTVYLAGPANAQGRICADNIVTNNTKEYQGSIATAIAKVFDLTVASTGAAEKVLKQNNIDYISSITHSASHAGYYPNAFPMSIKIVFSPKDGIVYGAQIIGYDGVDKRIDLIATVIKRGGSIYDLQQIEHAYAPPFSSAKDPVNMAGYVAENIITGTTKIIHWYDMQNLENKDVFLVDVRNPEEFELGYIENAINIPVNDLRDNFDKLPKDKPIYLYCGVGLRGYLASRILLQNGFDNVYNLSGGYKTYEFVTQKQSNEDIFEKEFVGTDDNIYKTNTKETNTNHVLNIDACGLQCPGPIMKLKTESQNLKVGDALKIKASDPGFMKDVESWCKLTGNKLIDLKSEKGIIEAVIKKTENPSPTGSSVTSKEQTMVIFSDDFDKAIASFIIANGGLASGRKVTMFFTFWGLSILKKNKKPKVKKDFMGKMFSKMLPKSSKKLSLSKMNFGGIGVKMMRNRMKKKGVDSLESMIKQAIDNGVNIVACQMSMDMMGIDKNELMDGVKIGGVAAYLEAASTSNHNIFI